MYKCTNCGAVMEDCILMRNHLTQDEHYAVEEGCPYCYNYVYFITEEGDEDDN